MRHMVAIFHISHTRISLLESGVPRCCPYPAIYGAHSYTHYVPSPIQTIHAHDDGIRIAWRPTPRAPLTRLSVAAAAAPSALTPSLNNYLTLLSFICHHGVRGRKALNSFMLTEVLHHLPSTARRAKRAADLEMNPRGCPPRCRPPRRAAKV
eukprot:6179090-Pleurochrysis_carterae.AAC.3